MLSLRSILRKADIHFGWPWIQAIFWLEWGTLARHTLTFVQTVHWKLERFQTIRPDSMRDLHLGHPPMKSSFEKGLYPRP
jgi:hypothetical protein